MQSEGDVKHPDLRRIYSRQYNNAHEKKMKRQNRLEHVAAITRRAAWRSALCCCASLGLALPAFAQQQPPDAASAQPPNVAPATSAPATFASPLLSFARAAADHGVYFTSYIDAEFAANPAGGIRQGAAASQYGTIGTNIDLEKLVGWKGALFHATIIAESSTGLSAKYIGGGIDAQENYAPFSLVRFLNLSLEQNLSLLHHNDLNLIAGRMGAFPAFARSDYACQFMNHVFCGALYGFSQDTGTALAPLATWGGRARYNFTPKIYAQAGGFAIDGKTLLQSTHLFDLGTNGVTGTDWLAEAGYESNFSNSVLPGNYRVGASFLDAPRNDVLLNTAGLPYYSDGGKKLTHRGETSFYLMGDQVVYRPDLGSTRNLAVFGTVFYNANNTEAVQYAVKAGLVQTGTFPGRIHDTVGFAVSQTGFTSHEMQYLDGMQIAGGGPGNVPSKEYIFELTYGYQLAPGVTLRPDLQYIMNPDPRDTPEYPKKIPNAFVVGLAINISLDRLLGLPQLGR